MPGGMNVEELTLPVAKVGIVWASLEHYWRAGPGGVDKGELTVWPVYL